MQELTPKRIAMSKNGMKYLDCAKFIINDLLVKILEPTLAALVVQVRYPQR